MSEGRPLRWLASLLLLAGASMAGAADPSPRDVLADRLGQVLRTLDRDQTRQMSRTNATGERAFEKTSLDPVLHALQDADRATYVLIGKRGTGSRAPLDLRRILRVEPRPSEEGREAVGNDGIPAYIASRPAPDWGAVLATVVQAPGAVESTTPAQAMQILVSTREARYVVQMGAGGDASAIDRLIVLPDTLMITIGADSGHGATGGVAVQSASSASGRASVAADEGQGNARLDVPSHPPIEAPAPEPEENLHRPPVLPPPDNP